MWFAKKRNPLDAERLYGIIGRPLVHSYSRQFFAEKFKGVDEVAYENFELKDIEELPALIAGHPNLRGLNVTIPYKRDVMAYLDDIDENARIIGAVNVVKITRDEAGKPRLKGYNTDFYGFMTALKPMLTPEHRHALVLGTGGASKAVLHALDTLGLTHQYVSRTPGDDRIGYSDLTPEVMARHTVVINTTPVGTFPKVKECPPVPYECITPGHVVFDLIYNPIRTLFLNQAELKGAAIKNGWEMFVYQALKTYEIWEGVRMTHEF